MTPNQRPLRFLVAIITLSILALLTGPDIAGAVHYEIKQISDHGFTWSYTPHYINNRGEIVWAGYYDDPSHKDIYLYKNGSATKLISTIYSMNVNINDNGDILYDDGWDSHRLHLYSNGNISHIDCDSINGYPSGYDSSKACINNSRQIALVKHELQDDGKFHYSLCIYDNGITTTIYNAGLKVIDCLDINNAGQVVFITSDGHGRQVFFYKDGGTTNLTNYDYEQDEMFGAVSVKINNNGQIVWGDVFPDLLATGLQRVNLWEDGRTTTIVSPETYNLFSVSLNDLGQIIWWTTDPGNFSNNAIYLLNTFNHNDVPRLVNRGYWFYPAINNLGQIVWSSGNSIFLATPQVEVASFIFPVLGNSITDPLKNINDPLQDGWTGNKVGANPRVDLLGHLGQDYYLINGDSVYKPVYAITKGEVVKVMNGPGKYGWCDDSDHGWGPVVVLKHTSDTGFKVSDNAIIPLGNCGTDRNPKVIYSLYGHLSKDSIKDIVVGQTFETGDLIGNIGKCGNIGEDNVDVISWTTNHLHFEIKDEVGFLEGGWYISHPGECPGSAAQSCDAKGIGTGYSKRPSFAPHRYIPSVFIIENQGRKAHIQGVINLLMSD